tara:strand:+ start:2205 stop:2537 length:333 start_codon:yes stop_codon:yes gene_type:complete
MYPLANLLIIPLKMIALSGTTEYQYKRPSNPCGLTVPVCINSSSTILNSSQASPGSLISANKRSLTSSLFKYKTLQQSSASPDINFVLFVRSLLNPTPPISLSRITSKSP